MQLPGRGSSRSFMIKVATGGSCRRFMQEVPGGEALALCSSCFNFLGTEPDSHYPDEEYISPRAVKRSSFQTLDSGGSTSLASWILVSQQQLEKKNLISSYERSFSSCSWKIADPLSEFLLMFSNGKH